MRARAVTVFSYAVLILGVVPMVFPFVWMVLTSLKPFREIFSLSLVPSEPTLANYVLLFSRTMFPRWFFNSLLVGGITVASVLATRLATDSSSRLRRSSATIPASSSCAAGR